MSRVFIFTRSSVYRTSNEFDQIPSVNINYTKASLSALLCWVLFFSLNLAASESQVDVHVLNYVRAKTAVNFGGDPYQANFIPITDGWNYVVRMYRPRPSIIDRSWTFPSLE